MKLEELKARLAELQAANEAFLAACENEGRDLSDDDNAKIDANLAEIERITATVTRLERIQAGPGGSGRKTQPGKPGGAEDKPKPQAFRSLGDFCRDVALSAGGSPTARLQAAATTWSEEGTGSSAGFLVPPDFSRDIYKAVDAEFSLLSLTSQVPVSGNTLSLTVDENPSWGTGGVRVYRTAEAATITQSRPTFKRVNVPVDKLSALVYVTDELLEDAPQLEAHLRQAVPEAMDFAIANEIINGTGTGEMLGIVNSGALVTQAAESAQTADTIKAENIFKMYSRMPARHLSRAVWLVNPDALPQLFGMVIGTQPIFTPANAGITQAPYGSLMGRPLIPHQVAKSIGDLGDIMFLDLSAYRVGRKATGLRVDTSIHVEFERNMTAFRFNFRIGGQPMLSAPIDPKNGSNTLSPFVALAAR